MCHAIVFYLQHHGCVNISEHDVLYQTEWEFCNMKSCSGDKVIDCHKNCLFFFRNNLTPTVFKIEKKRIILLDVKVMNSVWIIMFFFPLCMINNSKYSVNK